LIAAATLGIESSDGINTANPKGTLDVEEKLW
jgi:hypothetical protein